MRSKLILTTPMLHSMRNPHYKMRVDGMLLLIFPFLSKASVAPAAPALLGLLNVQELQTLKHHLDDFRLLHLLTCVGLSCGLCARKPSVNNILHYGSNLLATSTCATSEAYRNVVVDLG